jgi:hypothetical protein
MVLQLFLHLSWTIHIPTNAPIDEDKVAGLRNIFGHYLRRNAIPIRNNIQQPLHFYETERRH